MNHLKLILVLALSAFSQVVFADAPDCRDNQGAPYCIYEGKVKNLYINDSNLILVYFDTAGDLDNIRQVFPDTWNASAHVSAGYNLNDNLEFGKLLYSTLLAAKASGSEVAIQMRGNTSGYLRIDRIWLR